MKHTIQTLKKNLTLAEVEALETELRERLGTSGEIDAYNMIKEILGK